LEIGNSKIGNRQSKIVNHKGALMLGRRREQILTIVGLIGLNILLGWCLGRLWKDYCNRTQSLYAAAPAEPPATPAAGSNQVGQPQSFVEIVDRNVFSPLRGSPLAQSQEEAKAPKPPFLFGTMNLGNGWFALMAPGDQSSPVSKRVLPGEEIGGYKLVSIGTSSVVLEWQEKKITLGMSESARRVPGNVEKTASTGARSAPVSAAGSPAATTIMPIAPVSVGGPPPPVPQFAPPGASPDAPPGTVIGGRRKVLVQTPFGTLVQWQEVGQPGSQAPQQSGTPNK
jgi:hypothetical protein